jgi:hypothetical protein
MARVPLSQVYGTLKEEQKNLFIKMIDPLMEESGDNYKLVEYENYDGKPISSKLTLKEWFRSLIDPGSMQTVRGRKVDKLSPPPGLIEAKDDIPYSMGAMDLSQSEGLPLIEGRGYAKIKVKDKEMSLLNILPFIKEEVEWFLSKK